MKAAALRLFMLEAGGEIRTAEDAASTATRIYEKLLRHLAPVVGETGFQALFARSLKLTKPSFACLKGVETNGPEGTALGQLCACLKEQTPSVTTEIVTSIVASFIGLLSTFIGEGLTWKLLCNAWPEVLLNEPPHGENP